MLAPLYTADNCRAAFQLNWSVSVFWRASPPPECQWLDSLKQSTEVDGIRTLEHRFKNDEVSQFLASTRPESAPPQIVRSLKGRLQYLLREQLPKAFRRNYSIHSIGSANLAAVEAYVASQLEHHKMADERAEHRLAQYQIYRPEVDLSLPMRGAHGEYHFNLHVVLVRVARCIEVRDDALTAVHEMLLKATAVNADVSRCTESINARSPSYQLQCFR